MQFTSSAQRESAQINRRLDRELTAFREASEGWFDGTPVSVDRRLAACTTLLNRARGALARSPFDPEPVRVTAELESIRRGLIGLKQDLLTGYADRVIEVRPAARQRTAFSPPNPPANLNESLKPLWRQDVEAGIDPMERHLPEQYRTHHEGGMWNGEEIPGWEPGTPLPDNWRPQRSQDPAPVEPSSPGELPLYDQQAGDWAVPSLHRDMTGDPQPREPRPTPAVQYGKPPGASPDKSVYDKPYQGPETPRQNRPRISPEKMQELNSLGGGKPFDPRKATLTPEETRWVSLQAPKFVHANLDTLDLLSEMATRAQFFIAKAASATDHPHAVGRAFVAAVLETARRQPRVSRKTAARVDCSDIEDHSAMFL